MSYRAVFILLTLVSCGYAQEGKFITPDDETELFGDNAEVSFSFPYFGNTVSSIRIYRHGVVGIGATPVPSCPFNNLLGSGVNFIAPYWLPASPNSGSVTYGTIEGSNINGGDRARLRQDLKNTYQNDDSENSIENGEIEKLFVVTWDGLTNEALNAQKSNCFQLIILVTNDGRSYAFFIYRKTDFQVVTVNGPNDAACQNTAVSAIGAGNFFQNFELSQFFKGEDNSAKPLLISYNTNIKNYKKLGRYVLRLFGGQGSQVTPPTQDCSKPPRPDGCTEGRSSKGRPGRPGEGPRFFYSAVSFSKRFCKYRKAGQYSHPLYCDHFMTCGVGGQRADVHRCPDGLNYNEILDVCDHEENLECNLPKSLKIIPTDLKTEEPQVVIHGNRCLLKGWKDIADPTTCEYFLSCTNSRTIRRKCPDNLYFDVEKNYCNYAHQVDCVNGIRPTGPPATKSHDDEGYDRYVYP